MKRLIEKILLLSLLITLPIPIYTENNYEKINRDQAENWLKSITYEELLDFIIKWDYIEHTSPNFIFPRYVAIIDDNDIYLQPESNTMIYTHGYLSYTFSTPQYEYKNIIPEKESNWQWHLIGYTATFLVSAVLGGWLGWEIAH
jgi:hypothetical protein